MNDSVSRTRQFGQQAKARITGIECIPLHIPFKVPFKIASGAAREVMETLLVKVRTDQGVIGIGETHAWRRQGSAETLPVLINVIKCNFEPVMLGRSPCDIASIMHDLEQRMYHTQYAQAAARRYLGPFGIELTPAQHRQHVLDVCGLHELEATEFDERDVTPGQLDFQQGAVM